jgi:hypothetical protein
MVTVYGGEKRRSISMVARAEIPHCVSLGSVENMGRDSMQARIHKTLTNFLYYC